MTSAPEPFARVTMVFGNAYLTLNGKDGVIDVLFGNEVNAHELVDNINAAVAPLQAKAELAKNMEAALHVARFELMGHGFREKDDVIVQIDLNLADYDKLVGLKGEGK